MQTSATESRRINPALLAVQAAGSRAKLGRAIQPPVCRQAVDKWVRDGRIPLKRVSAVSKATGIPKKLLDPAFDE